MVFPVTVVIVGDLLSGTLFKRCTTLTPPGPSEIWGVLEGSATVDRGDIERAQRGAALLRQAHYPAMAVAGGREATAGARQVAGDFGVALLLDGHIEGWQQAFARMLAEREAGRGC